MYTTTFVISYQITYTHYLTEEHITKYDTERIINRLLMKQIKYLKKNLLAHTVYLDILSQSWKIN